jgi:hypothetical protein
LIPNPEYSEISEFLSWLYRDETGYVYVARRAIPHGLFRQTFFRWPEDSSVLASHIIKQTSQREVWIAPALFSEPSAVKSAFLGSHVAWAEFDGNEPKDYGAVPVPQLRIQSSTEGHTHCYWNLGFFDTDRDSVEARNKTLTRILHADPSGWDCNQVLRPPGTFNHKRGLQTEVLHWADFGTFPKSFEITASPELAAVEFNLDPNEFPSPNAVIGKSSVSQKLRDLFMSDSVQVGRRSTALMELGHLCVESDLTPEEALSLLINADERWGKFKNRDNQLELLQRILTVAFQKKAKIEITQEKDEQEFESIQAQFIFNAYDLVETELSVDWVINEILPQEEMFIIAGEPAIGKSSLSLQGCIDLALGRPFLGFEVVKPQKIAYISLEMGQVGMKQFLAKMLEAEKENRDAISNNLLIAAFGQALYLEDKPYSDWLRKFVEKYELQGLVFDSLGSSIRGSLISDDTVRAALDVASSLQAEFGIWTWFVHHNRKASSEGTSTVLLDDVFGSRYISTRPASICVLSRKLNFVRLSWVKTRYAELPNSLFLKRDSNLHYTISHNTGQTKPKDISVTGTKGTTTISLGLT